VGINPLQYNSTLPSGTYTFCFEAFDDFTGSRLSQQGCTQVFLVSNDPPFVH